MKIMFEDGSFIEIDPKDDDNINIILCGIRDTKSATMSYTCLNRTQTEQVIEFLQKWLKEKE